MEATGENSGTVALLKKKVGKSGETSTDCEIQDTGHVPKNPRELPEELLEMIIFRLENPDDFFTVSNTCPQFQRILKPRTPVWSFDMAFPLIFANLERQDILNCRLVCKEWNKTVEQFLQTHPIIRSLEPYPRQSNPRRTYAAGSNHGPQYLPTLIQKGFYGSSFVTGRSIIQFLANTLAHPGNPFVMRYVELANCPAQEPLPEFYWFNVDNLLQRFGHHIWHIHLSPRSIYVNRDTIDDCYKILKKALVQLPNLRKLSISGFKGYDLDPEDNNQFLELADYIQMHPLPPLPYLEVMECAIPVNPKTVCVTDELMSRYASQINKIFVWLTGWQNDKIQYRNMLNLREMQISVNDTHLVCVQMIQSLNAPQLRKIYMIFQVDVEIMPILEALKNSCPSLTYLGLWFRMKPEDSFATLSPPQFLLDGVKTLELVESEHIPYELVLSYFTNLEHLLILGDPSPSNVDDQKNDSGVGEEQHVPQSEMRELMITREIYKSEIWGRIKTLKEFTLATSMGEGLQEEQIVAKKQFTREMYEYLKKQQMEKI